jgi:hypothetical protein
VLPLLGVGVDVEDDVLRPVSMDVQLAGLSVSARGKWSSSPSKAPTSKKQTRPELHRRRRTPVSPPPAGTRRVLGRWEKKMKKVGIIVAATAIALAVGAGSWLAWSASRTTTVYRRPAAQVSAPATPLPADDPEGVVRIALQNHGIPVNVPDDALANLGANICGYLDYDYPVADIAADFMQTFDLTFEDASFAVGAFVAAYCPEHVAKV